LKSVQIHGVGNHFDASRGDLPNTFDPLPAPAVYCYVPKDSRKIERRFHRCPKAMTDKDRRDLGKMEQGFDYLRVVVSVNNLGCLGETAQLVGYLDAVASDLLSYRPQFG
jgi:hypothetical protein